MEPPPPVSPPITSPAPTPTPPTSSLTYLEFYSGVGGWSMAIERALRRSRASDGGGGGSAARCERLASFDHSHLCNRVFRYNFPDAPADDAVGRKRGRKGNRKGGGGGAKPSTDAIERLTREQLEDWNAFLWAMSPPCQPYTRQHSNQNEELTDPRNKSFLHLCEMIRIMEEDTLPRVVVLENVVGFEKSQSCLKWRTVLHSRNYRVVHLHLTPPQVGIPNDRPRYYSIALRRRHRDAKKKPVPNDDGDEEEGCLVPSRQNEGDDEKNAALASWFESKHHPHHDRRHDESVRSTDKCPVHTGIPPLGVHSHNDGGGVVPPCRPLSHYLDAASTTTDTDRSSLYVTPKTLSASASWCFDVVTPSTKRSACFTQSYGRFVRGTGSVLYLHPRTVGTEDGAGGEEEGGVPSFDLVPPEERTFDRDWGVGIDDLSDRLRYFSGEEMARLMGFPIGRDRDERASVTSWPEDNGEEDGGRRGIEGGKKEGQITRFRFPPETTTRQKWKLLGNSLNVEVAARVVEAALRLADL